MLFQNTLIAAFLLIVSVQAMYVPHTVRDEYQGSQIMSSRGIDITDNVLFLSARDPKIDTSGVLLGRAGAGESPPPIADECCSKADCQTHIRRVYVSWHDPNTYSTQPAKKQQVENAVHNSGHTANAEHRGASDAIIR